MAFEIIKLYTSSLSQFFTLSDANLAGSSVKKEHEDLPIPPFVPTGTSVLSACYFSEKLADEIAECVSELNGVDVGPEAVHNLKSLLESVRWRFEEVIASTWSRGKRHNDHI